MIEGTQKTQEDTAVYLSVSKRWTIAFLLFALLLCVYSVGIDSRPFYSRGESREALVVRAMFDQSDFLLPRRNGTVIPSKPPLFHWFGAAAARAFGSLDEFSIRFPSVVCAALCLAFLFAVIAESGGAAAAVLTIAMLITSLEWSRSATSARVDMCFTAWLTIATLALFKNLLNWQKRRPLSVAWFCTAAIATTLAVLAKGPTGLALPWLIVGCYAMASNTRSIKEFFVTLPYLPCCLTFGFSFFASTLWYWLAFRHQGYDFVEVQLLRENVSRLISVEGESRGHSGTIVSGPLFLCMIFLPWSLLLPLLCTWLWQTRKSLREGKRPEVVFCIVWVVVYLAAITLSKSKREVYLLPAMPPVAWLTSCLCLEYSKESISLARTRKSIAVAFGAVGFLLALTVCVTGFISYEGVDEFFASLYRAPHVGKDVVEVLLLISHSYAIPASIILAACCFALASRKLWGCRMLSFCRYLSLGMIAVLVCIDQCIMPTFSEFRTSKSFMHEVTKLVTPNEALLRYKFDLFSATYYANRNIAEVKDLSEMRDSKDVFLLVRIEDLEEVQAALPQGNVLLESDTYAADGQGRLALVKL